MNNLDKQLIFSSSEGNLAEVRRLITAGANINAKDDCGYTSLQCASWNGHVDVVDCLLSKGANVEAQTFKGLTSLHLASWMGHIDIVDRLLSKGADVNAKDDGCWTSLYYASLNSYIGVVARLVSKGADINARTIYGGTSMSIAQRYGHSEIVRLLNQAERWITWKRQVAQLYQTALILYRTSSETVLDSMDIGGTRAMLFEELCI